MTIHILIIDEEDNVLQDFRIRKPRQKYTRELSSDDLAQRIRTRLEYLFEIIPQPHDPENLP